MPTHQCFASRQALSKALQNKGDEAGWAFRTSLPEPFIPQGKDAHTQDSSSPSLWGPPWLTQHRHRLQDPLRVSGLCWQAAAALAAQPGWMSWCIFWRPQPSLPGPKVPAGAGRRGSSAALIYAEHLLRGEGRNPFKHRKSRWWSGPGSPTPQQPGLAIPASNKGEKSPERRKEKGYLL